MKIKDIRKLKDEEIKKKLTELNIELVKLQGQSATGTPPKSPGQINQIKKIKARIYTVKREAELLAMSQGEIQKEQKNVEVKQVNARN